MKKRIGYLIPEFPGQTHIFFWRERQALTDLGVETKIISTQKPPSQIACHSWTREAQQQTSYLLQFTFIEIIQSLKVILKAKPKAWLACLLVIKNIKSLTLSQKLRLLALIIVAGKLVYLAKGEGISHIHIHSCADSANIALFASILSSLTYSLTLHGPTLEIYGANQEQKWKYAAFAIVVSEKLLQSVRQQLASFLPEKLTVAPMGVNLDEIKRYHSYIPWNNTEPCRIFSCGRLNPVKGHNFLIETVKLLREKGFDIRLKIAGEDEQGGKGYHQELNTFIQQQSLSDKVELLGAIPQERIRQELEEAHIFALASLNEGIPVAVMEAMAMELPIVVTDVGGNAELIDREVDAILVPSKQPDVMAEAIIQIIQNPKKAIHLSQAARQKIQKKFYHQRSAEVIVSYLEELYPINNK